MSLHNKILKMFEAATAKKEPEKQPEEKIATRHVLGKLVVSKTGKKFGEVANLSFDVRTGEILHLHLKNPTGYCESLALERDKSGAILIPFSSVIAIGDFVVIAEEDII